MQQDINLFMVSKYHNVAFLSDENWLNDLQFLNTREKSACE